MVFEWHGVFPALITPFTAKDELDMDLFGKSLNAQTEAGVHGIILGGTLGESSTLTVAEKEKLVRYSKDKTEGKVPIILNIAEGGTRIAIEQADFAAKWGADGLMLLPPMRYKSDPRETIQYFRAVAESTPLPIIIYNNPVDYKVEVTPEMFAELVSCANIQAVKESTREISNVTKMINRHGERFKILCGVDTIAMEALVMGAHGWVAGLVCAFPKETVSIYELVREGRIEEALAIHRWFMPLLELDLLPKLVQYIKLAAQETGIGSEFVRAPRLTLMGDERERVLRIIREGIRHRPVLS